MCELDRHENSMSSLDRRGRTRVAEKEAQRFGASWAVLLVQSFNRQADQPSFQDFVRFSELMLAPAAEGQLAASTRRCGAVSLDWKD